eukprot:TRINITY_DN100441_c0_g1_i1.p1 TRINITY_DN100441_c0_g1~~TRINITY_DN100441_c0_g1_i1.p1  ORF type:complete len:2164 (+),score=634.46 TRINITY_DN100441_c0_g1_i1:71-6562(+)
MTADVALAAEELLQVFRSTLSSKDGHITKKSLGRILKALEPDRWSDQNLSELFCAASLHWTGDRVQVESLVAWLTSEEARAPASARPLPTRQPDAAPAVSPESQSECVSAPVSADGAVRTAAGSGSTLPSWTAGARTLPVFAPDSKTLLVITNEERAQLLDGESGKLLVEYGDPEDRVLAAVFAGDGNRVHTASRSGVVKTYDAVSGRNLSTVGDCGTASSATFSASGSLVAVVTAEGQVVLLNTQTGALERLDVESPPGSARFSPDESKVCVTLPQSDAVGGNVGVFRIEKVTPVMAKKKTKKAGVKFNSEDKEEKANSEEECACDGTRIRKSKEPKFAEPELSKASVSFAEKADERDAASVMGDGPKRSVKQRVNTGFVREAPKKGGVRFATEDDVEEKVSPVGKAPKPKKKGPRFALEVEEEEKEKTPSDPKASKKNGLRFAQDAEELEAATPGSSSNRSVHGRIATGFAFQAPAAEEAKKQLKFSEDAEELDAASTGGDSTRSVRGRVSTGFALKASAAEESRRELKFVEDVEEAEAASLASSSGRSVRGRVSTGFAFQAPSAEEPRKELKFAADAEELEAASTGGSSGRSVRGRVSTGFAFKAPSAEEPRKELKFAEDAEQLEAASIGGSSGRSVRGRVSTGFAFKAPEAEESSRRELKFAEDAEELEAASTGGSSTRSVRGRVSTGFQFKAPAAEESRRELKFVEDVEEVEAASVGGSSGRSVRGRVSTGFAFQAPPEEPKPTPKLRFSEDDAEELDAASEAAGSTRSAKGRVATGFSFSAKEEEDVPRTRFTEDDPEQLDAASESAQSGRSVRGRVSTGFSFGSQAEDEDPSRGLRFAEEDEELAAASEADGSTRSVKGRVQTGFLTPKDTKPQALEFDEEPEELEAASTASTLGRSPKTRIATGFVSQADDDQEEDDEYRGISFAEDDDILDAASPQADEARSIRGRVSTGFVPKGAKSPQKSASFSQEDDDEDVFEVRFSQKDEVLEAASEIVAEKPARTIRGRVSTGFARAKDIKQAIPSAKISTDQVDVLDAASEGAEGPKREVRTRVNTGFVKKEDLRQRELRTTELSDAAPEVLEAASEAPRSARSVRGRLSTGFSHEGTLVDASDVGELVVQPDNRAKRMCVTLSDKVETSELEDTGAEDAKPKRSVRNRVSTGFVAGADLLDDNDGCEEESDDPDDEDGSDSEEEEDPEELKLRNSIVLVGRKSSVKISLSSQEMKNIARLSMKGQLLGGTGNLNSSNTIERQRSAEQKMDSAMAEKVVAARQRYNCVQSPSINMSAKMAKAFQDGENPEHTLDDRLVLDCTKDISFLVENLKPLIFFEDMTHRALKELAEALEVYEFHDEEDVIRQGDTDGSHFFIVESGCFVVMKDGVSVAELTEGMAFGEAVLLIDGTRTATVRSKGTSRVYAMEGEMVREVLQLQYELEKMEVVELIEKILMSDSCDVFRGLNTFQLNKINTEAEVVNFKHGDVVIQEGAKSHTGYILVTGSAKAMAGGNDLFRIRRYEMVGHRGMIYEKSPVSVLADGTAKMLALPEATLKDLFGDKMATVLLHDSVLRAIHRVKELSSIHDDQKEALSRSFELVTLQQGEALDVTNVCIVLLLNGHLDVTHAGGETKKISNSSSRNCFLAKDFMKNTPVWEYTVTSPDGTANLAVWRKTALHEIAAEDVMEKRMRVLKTVFLFKTLPPRQLYQLASAMMEDNFKREDTIIKQGDHGDAFYIIKVGRVQIEKSGRYIRALMPGDYFGERALIVGEPRSATIIAAEDCILLRIGRDTFNEVMKGPPLDYLKIRITLQDSEFTFEDLRYLRVVGKGGFGIVKMVQTKAGERYALKCISKKEVVQKKLQESVLNERQLLADVDHPFILKLVQTFRNQRFLYLLTELVTGGELLNVLEKLGLLNQQQAQFYTGSIALALEYLHVRRIAYLDLKGENVLIDHQGYCKLVDFGIATRIAGATSHALKGTPHFMSPEMILHKGYDTSADLWSLGVMLYDFMIGDLPFGHKCTNNGQILKAILKSPLTFPDWFQEKSFGGVAMDLVKDLLSRDPGRRPGAGVDGYNALKRHPFFNGFDFDELLGHRLIPPFVPGGEIFSEDSSRPNSQEEGAKGSKQSGRFRTKKDKGFSLEKEEADAEKVALEDGWTDPDPGWDDDFAND